LRHGERLDPDNGFYNLEIALLLVGASCNFQDDPSATYDRLTRDGRVEAVAVEKMEITDAQRFQQGLEEFHRTLAKPKLTAYSIDMLKARLAVLPAPTRFIQYLDRLSIYISVLPPPLQDYRQFSKSVLAYSRSLAAEGRGEEALRICREVEYTAAKMGAQTDTLIGLLVAQAIHQHALGYEEVIDKELGRAQAAQAARQARMEGYEFYNRILEGLHWYDMKRSRLGLLESMVFPGLPGYKVDLKPVRTAEQFVIAQVGLLVLLALLVLAAIVLILGTLLERMIVPKSQRAVLLFVGWRRLGKIYLLGVVVPVAVYVCYAFAMALWGPNIGLAGAWDRVCVEFLALGCIVLFLLVRLSRTAIAQRALELGMGVPPQPYWRSHPWRTAVLAILGIGLVAYIVGWWAGPFRLMGSRNSAPFMILTTVVVLALGVVAMARIGWMLWWTLRAKLSRRAFLPVAISVAALIVIGIILSNLLSAKSITTKSDGEVLTLAFLFAIGIVVAGWLFWWMLVGGRAQRASTPELRRFARTLRRSLIPILAAAVIVVGIGLGGSLAVGEGYAIHKTGKALPMPDEIKNSDFRLLQERFVRLEEQMEPRTSGNTSELPR
jgi:hypothetical protein